MHEVVMERPAIDVAPLRLGRTLWAFAIIYGLGIVTCYIVNMIVQAAPIGPWATPKDIATNYWLDNVTWQLMSLWFAVLSGVSSGFPFQRIENSMTRGVCVSATSWVIGWFAAKGIYWAGLGADWVFPIVGCAFFFLAFFAFIGESWIVAGMPPQRRFFILFTLVTFLTYAVTNSSIRWIPAWWFPFIEVGLASGLLSYYTRGMTQPGKAFVSAGLLFVAMLVFLWGCHQLRYWDPTQPGVGAFWTIGTYANPTWLLWFLISCSVTHAMVAQAYGWPFSHVPQPWGGLLALAGTFLVTTLLTKLLLSLVGTVFTDVNEAMTYGYMPTHWSFVMAAVFGFGADLPYLWRGQKTPGTWDDVA